MRSRDLRAGCLPPPESFCLFGLSAASPSLLPTAGRNHGDDLACEKSPLRGIGINCPGCPLSAAAVDESFVLLTTLLSSRHAVSCRPPGPQGRQCRHLSSIADSPSTAPPNAANFATLREIEGRLKSIKNIEKITNTMKIVASTRLTRAQKAMEESRVYGQTSNTVFENAETKALDGKKTLLVVASSDKGLCGGIHSGLSKATRRIMAENEGADIVVLGEKAKAQLSRTNAQNIVLSFSNVCKDIPTFADAQAIADQIALLPTDYASVKIIYNRFINAQSYEPAVVEAYSEEAITNSPNISAFEIGDEVLANLREYALANSLFWALAEGHACEISNASKNAGDMIQKISVLTPSRFQILYNRQRQAAITGELVEIITGATASEDMS
ncbi:ATP synthase gamma chain [Rasamsonia emersonii CBS 393.64]|uniref:ATP synthase subunit gamma, mitochondrial n=1 Tax=Rasamsonia emersonii (strain ATCC 16479 / CBS 393.64 / IMI 116815) TaxID=1408163 RepID=A0A0F4Z4R0_RASE3|nr:ATP synthase gamma chain [Rasamsonia emersonii CBS 393.64]KKA25081.1 ATP synthase gamma chain [Rasamsonia emersonii CBS 393.64]